MKKEDIMNLSEKLLLHMTCTDEAFDGLLYNYMSKNPEYLEGEFEAPSPEELLNNPKIKEHLLHTMKTLINSIKIERDCQMEELIRKIFD